MLASGGWHPRDGRVLVTASDGDYGFALVDGNGDGAELEQEQWQWEDAPGGDGRWEGGSTSGADPLVISRRSWPVGASGRRTSPTAVFPGVSP